MKRWSEVTRAFFESNKFHLQARDPYYTSKMKKNSKNVKNREKIVMNLPYNFILQRFFDTQCEQDSAASKSTFLFRELDEERIIKFLIKEKMEENEDPSVEIEIDECHVDVSKNCYSYKVLLDWDIKYDGEVLS